MHLHFKAYYMLEWRIVDSSVIFLFSYEQTINILRNNDALLIRHSKKFIFFFYKQTNNILRNLDRTPPHNIQHKLLPKPWSWIARLSLVLVDSSLIIGRKVFKLDERWSAQFEMWRKWCSEVSVVGRIQSLDGVKQLIKCPGKKIFFWMWSLLLT